MLGGLNHITITVNSLDESIDFYVDILGFCLHARWHTGAYLSCGNLWYCLALGKAMPSQDYSHLAFTICKTDFKKMNDQLRQSGVRCWQANQSEGESLYLLDPNGHKLEIHVGNLQTRLESLKTMPYDGLEIHNNN